MTLAFRVWPVHAELMLSTALDVFRLRQYFNVITRTRELADGIRDDAGLIRDSRRALVTLPFDRRQPVDTQPFGAREPLRLPHLKGKRVALLATGGSGALASVVGAARALEEGGIRPSVISLCSGSALFGFPIAAGIPADEVAAFILGISPDEYVDVDWRLLASTLPRMGRGFGGVIRGDRLLVELDGEFPGYGLAEHKGYGCPAHLAALARLGPT